MAFLGKQMTRAKRTDIRKQPTVFAAHCDPQTVPAKALRNTTYIYGRGGKTRRTGKPE